MLSHIITLFVCFLIELYKLFVCCCYIRSCFCEKFLAFRWQSGMQSLGEGFSPCFLTPVKKFSIKKQLWLNRKGMDWKAIISQKYQEAWKVGWRKAGIRETRHLQAQSDVLPVTMWLWHFAQHLPLPETGHCCAHCCHCYGLHCSQCFVSKNQLKSLEWEHLIG